jgi:hypothetical protein
MNMLYYLEGIMTQKNEGLAAQRKHLSKLEKLFLLLVCLSLPVALYGVTGHPAFIMIFISGLGGFGVYLAGVCNMKEGL